MLYAFNLFSLRFILLKIFLFIAKQFPQCFIRTLFHITSTRHSVVCLTIASSGVMHDIWFTLYQVFYPVEMNNWYTCI